MENAELKELLTISRTHLAKNGIQSDQLHDTIVSKLVQISEDISNHAITFENKQYNRIDRKIDSIITSRIFGIPIMLGLLGVVFWITIAGANYPSQIIANFLFWIEDILTNFFFWAGTPKWVHGLLVMGVYRTLAWVISVMLPPMAIFFPLFTLLEDLGYLPRVAFNLDNFFKKACAHGKQALTMCMGFGCNATGIIGCRIIDSPRERLIATITNNFVPCNGRFPTIIAIITMFFSGMVVGPLQSIVSTLLLTGVIILGILMTLLVSKLLSKTILKGLPSSFTLELPPYRKPQIGRVIVRSVFDRTLFVLGRAAMVAAPAGVIIWIMANIYAGNQSLLSHCANFLDPLAKFLGLDGYILMAFILGFPANEIVIPIIIMSYMATGSMLELDSLVQLRSLLISHGWTWLTAVCVMLFSLMHWPCGTTCLTIKKETQSWKWTLVSFLVPTIAGIIICFIFTTTVRLLGLV
jgi:ferrous iron transport protein B